MSSIIKPILDLGMARLLADDKAAESTKSGTLRGGNSGIYIETKDKFAGKCQRLSYLRYKGISIESTTASRKLMFQAGVVNEDLWLNVLKKAWHGPILTESEIPTSWQTSNGTPVTGRPDIVLCEPDSDIEGMYWDDETDTWTIPGSLLTQGMDVVGAAIRRASKPKVGIELKQISSVWTARDVLLEGRPKFDHLVQAAHYSWQLNVPFELWYTSRMDWHGNQMLDRILPKYGTPKYNQFREYFEESYYRTVRSRNGNNYTKRIERAEFLKDKDNYGWEEGQVSAGVLKLLPFVIGYTLGWTEDGYLTYTSTLTGETNKTIISQDRLKEYYERVSKMDETKDLGQRPLTLKGDGTDANYSNCQYCPIRSVCDKAEKKGLDIWVEEVKKFVNDKNS